MNIDLLETTMLRVWLILVSGIAAVNGCNTGRLSEVDLPSAIRNMSVPSGADDIHVLIEAERLNARAGEATSLDPVIAFAGDAPITVEEREDPFLLYVVDASRGIVWPRMLVERHDIGRRVTLAPGEMRRPSAGKAWPYFRIDRRGRYWVVVLYEYCMLSGDEGDPPCDRKIVRSNPTPVTVR